MMRNNAILLILFLSFPVYGAERNCGEIKVENLYLSTDRSDGVMENSNIIFLEIRRIANTTDLCKQGGPEPVIYAYLERLHPAYDSLITMLARAYSNDQKLSLVVDDEFTIAGVNYRGVIETDERKKAYKIDGLSLLPLNTGGQGGS